MAFSSFLLTLDCAGALGPYFSSLCSCLDISLLAGVAEFNVEGTSDLLPSFVSITELVILCQRGGAGIVTL